MNTFSVWGRRILLFLSVNIAVVLTVSILLNLFGVQPYLNQYGMDYQSLAAFSLIWGMTGAFISLGLSRIMAKWTMGLKVIDPMTTEPQLAKLVQTVHMLSKAAGLPAMPEVALYDSPELNAFATGPTKSRALVAVSTGLLSRMNWNEVEGVLGHEVAHIANGDMVTMTLVQGVVNAFVMFLSRAAAWALANAMRSRDDNREGSGSNTMVYYISQFVFEIVFMILGSMIVAMFSRFREFRADAGGAKLAGRESMVAALKALQRTYEIVDEQDGSAAIATLKISGHGRGMMALFSTHPPLSERIERLQRA